MCGKHIEFHFNTALSNLGYNCIGASCWYSLVPSSTVNASSMNMFETKIDKYLRRVSYT